MITKINNPVLDLISPSVQGALFGADINMGGNFIENLPLTPTQNDHAASKFYVDQVASTAGGGVFLPAGFGPIPWSTSSIPVGWLLCDGATYSAATYPDLFAAIGYTYGGGGGIFAVPDMRGRVPSGMDDMNTLGSIMGPAGSVLNVAADALGGVMGTERHVLSVGELAQHNHPDSFSVSGSGTHGHTGSTNVDGDHDHSGGIVAGGPIDTSGGATGVGDTGTDGDHSHTVTIPTSGSHSHSIGGSVGDRGSNQSHQNMQPTRFFGYIIKSTDATLAFPGDITMGGNRITGLADPIAPQDAATMNYVDNQIAANNTYDVALFIGGLVTVVGKEVARFPAVRPFTIQPGFGSSQASCRVAPTGGSAIFDIRKQGFGVIGTITFTLGSTTGTFAVLQPAQLSFTLGQILRITAQTADPGQEDIGITIEAMR